MKNISKNTFCVENCTLSKLLPYLYAEPRRFNFPRGRLIDQRLRVNNNTHYKKVKCTSREASCSTRLPYRDSLTGVRSIEQLLGSALDQLEK